MDRLLDETELAAKHGLWLMSVTSALLIPDVAGALRHPSGEATGSRYRAWFSEFLGVAYDGYLSPEDAYRYRCSLAHQGSGGHPKAETGRILFLPPTNITMHKIRMGSIGPEGQNAVALDIRAFVADMVGVGRGWLNAHRNDPVVKVNLERSVRLHMQGISPFIVGSPVVG